MAAVEPYPGCERGVCATGWASDRVVMVGQAPSSKGSADPRHALTGRPMDFLCSLSGLSRMEYFRAFERHNIVPEWQGYRGAGAKTGSRFQWRHHDVRVRSLLYRADGRRVLCWGREVAAALVGAKRAKALDLLRFAPVDVEHCDEGECDVSRFAIAVLPHPSGLNRWWNEPENRAAGAAFLVGTSREVHASYRRWQEARRAATPPA